MNLLIKPPRKMTADEFYEFVNRPENDARWFELVRGEVIELSRPTRPHGVICANVTRILANYTFAKHYGYVCSNDTGVVLERDPDTVRGPDVALFDDVQRMEDLPERWGDTQPRLAVEVLSPNDRADYINRKITDYLENNVDLVWVLDPEARTVTVYRKNVGPKVLHEKDRLTGDDVLPGFRCKVADFFATPTRPKPDTKPPPKRRGKP
jgi:Uma2 family endonuclease